ncbi:class I SAM-dependent methyltransferase [Streptomyces sp. KMM 9044]|uniref:class I SAM-dependent methyltransferase n=1 Tax=Streptomyces sp. KMM 9044 TaxID=2744474 RepID=UPI002151F4F8|nr:class I SAM-dependent methyltransferase [Streptomyces sp. KMM 9044]WAX81831.1 class I SAM-dependent methyltransferase [Streptomyces sp. KMM 9044]
MAGDNPELYEARFPDPDRLAGRWTEDCPRRHGAGPRVLDIGRGSGRDATHLRGAGRRVTGADLSEAMLAHARTHPPGPEYVHTDLHNFDLGRAAFDAIVCLDSALLYCHTNNQLDGFLASCRRSLVPGGLLVGEMRNGAYFLGRTDLLDAPAVSSFVWQGTADRSTTTLTVDRTAPFLCRTRVTCGPGPTIRRNRARRRDRCPPVRSLRMRPCRSLQAVLGRARAVSGERARGAGCSGVTRAPPFSAPSAPPRAARARRGRPRPRPRRRTPRGRPAPWYG